MRKLLLAAVALLAVCASARATNVAMPNKLHGEWCHLAGGDQQNPHQQIFVRGNECRGGDNGITIDADGWGSEGSCSPDKVEQITANVYAIEASCDEDEGGHITFELIGDTLIMTWLSES
jgi:hypothetical protein